MGNLPPGSTSEDVRQYFETFGDIEEIFMPQGSGKDFSFVTFREQAAARAALTQSEQGGHQLNGRPISVKLPTEKKPASFGRPMGGPMGGGGFGRGGGGGYGRGGGDWGYGGGMRGGDYGYGGCAPRLQQRFSLLLSRSLSFLLSLSVACNPRPRLSQARRRL